MAVLIKQRLPVLGGSLKDGTVEQGQNSMRAENCAAFRLRVGL